jgi:hypothetical protein
VREHPLDELRLLDAGNHLQPPAAAHALLDLDPESRCRRPRSGDVCVLDSTRHSPSATFMDLRLVSSAQPAPSIKLSP